MTAFIISTEPLPLFVYGTLRPGGALYPGIEEFVAAHQPALLAGFDLYLAGYPAIRQSSRRGAVVHGDLLWFTDPVKALAACDSIESYRPPWTIMYIRAAIPVMPVQKVSAPVTAWAYLGGPGGYTDNYLVPSGDLKQARPGLWPHERKRKVRV